MDLSSPRSVYRHGWGAQSANAKTVAATWYLEILDARVWPTTIPFDIVEGSTPLLIGLDVTRHAYMVNRADPSYISFRSPTDYI